MQILGLPQILLQGRMPSPDPLLIKQERKIWDYRLLIHMCPIIYSTCQEVGKNCRICT